ncbi:MAG: hypothetical protein IT208_13250 [Chthonomonadales bacterium]|nr:hypothetical protein [Chthonomonadales bacterium]
MRPREGEGARIGRRAFLAGCAGAATMGGTGATTGATYEGRYIGGEGDAHYLSLLNAARRMLAPDPELQNLAMLYDPAWNGFTEGPTWNAWWIQNSYGPTLCSIPFLEEPYLTFLQNAQDLWFDQMGDGRRVGALGGVAPDGCLCDAARPGWIVYKQGDGRTDIHDWGVEFTAAGLLLQAELLLSTRDRVAISRYLPMLERCADFLETRRDPSNGLYLAGPAGNLLAPSYAGWRRPDGTYGMAYLAGLSVTTIAALERLEALERLAGRPEAAREHAGRRARALEALPRLATADGYFVKSLDPDGTRHGVFGAERHGYFEAVVNHDAIALDVVDDARAARIWRTMGAIRGLRPHDFVITNYPGLDDMYQPPTGIWEFGTWVNGANWSTCEARMILAYYRLGAWEDARRSMRRLLEFAHRYALDNPLSNFGGTVSWYRHPIYLTYDAFGVPAALLRGLFGYRYGAHALRITPRVPPGIARVEQRFPVRFGARRLFLTARGAGPLREVRVNGRPVPCADGSVELPYRDLPDTARVELLLGDAAPGKAQRLPRNRVPAPPPEGDPFWHDPPGRAGNGLPLRIGASSEGGNAFVGEIADVWLWRGALSDAKMASLAAGEPPRAAPAGHWRLAAQHEGLVPSLGEAPAARCARAVPVVDVDGVAAGRLAGGAYLEVEDHPALEPADGMTLAARIRAGALPEGGSRILDKVTVGAEDGYLLDTFPREGLRLVTPWGSVSAEERLPVGRWCLVAASFSPGGRLRLYMDGRRVADSAARPEAASAASFRDLAALAARLLRFHDAMARAGRAGAYEAAHARLALECVEAARRRRGMQARGALTPLASRRAQAEADLAHVHTALRHAESLARILERYAGATDDTRASIHALWNAAAG